MASGSMGAFGLYKLAYSRHRNELEKNVERKPKTEDTVWVIKRYVPTDLRVTAPAPRFKSVSPLEDNQLEESDECWIPPCENHPRYYSRIDEERDSFCSTPSTRSEEWSTLRQILPSAGRASRVVPPNWGTGFAKPPSMVPETQYKFWHINSPMTRYVDNMHSSNRLFRLH